MNTPNILLTRVDNRMFHGQAVVWTKTLGANLIVCADDILANDKATQTIMQMTADTAGVGIRFFTLDRTIEIIHKASPKQKIFIICKTPADVKKLIDGGVPIKELNLGNMHFTQGKEQISKKVFVDEQDKNDIKYLEDKGVDVFIQDVPGDIKSKVK
ncbi:MAG: PTS galactosamine transporter subunit IIB [Peptostreptococcaceae bacterium]